MKTKEEKAKKIIQYHSTPAIASSDMVDALEKIAEKFETTEELKIMVVKGEKGDKGEQGEEGPQGESGKDSTALGPKGDKGDKGEPGRDGADGQDGLNGVNPDPTEIVPLVLEQIKLPEYKETVLDNGEQIVQKINDLPTDNDDFKIDVSHIKGLKKFVKENQQTIISGGITGRDLFKDIDLTDQLDGVTTTFNIQGVWNIISVNLSSYPYGSLRKGVDYTWTPTSITFTSEIDASTQLAVGQKCILTVVLA
jgi:hypothetical protein